MTALVLVCIGAATGAQEEYLVGGPLAGVKLPLFKGLHGEPTGYPGGTPELQEKAKGTLFTGDDGNLFPELELYPGAEEHWRGYYVSRSPPRVPGDQMKRPTTELILLYLPLAVDRAEEPFRLQV